MTEASYSGMAPAGEHGSKRPSHDAGTTGALEPSLPAWGLSWRLVVSTIGVSSVVAAPWAGLWFYRWFAERIALPDGRRLRLDADVRGAWPLFVAIGLADWLEDGLGIALDGRVVLAVSVLIEAALCAWFVKWLVPRLCAKGDATRLGFEGSFFGLVAWTMLLYVGVVSVIGWAWALKNMLRWIARRISGTVAVEFHGTGFGILGRTLLLLLVSLLIVPIPWALKRWIDWIVSEFAVEPVGGDRARV